MPHYEVETLLGNSFENCWRNTADDTLVTFTTLGEAWSELQQMLADVKEAAAAGDMAEEYDPEDYRIVRVDGNDRQPLTIRANENGVYVNYATEEVARNGHSYAAVRICQCDDQLFRYALDLMYSYGGFSGPITIMDEGFATFSAARDAGMLELLKRWPKARPSEPQSVHAELRELKAQIERRFSQPSLF